MGVVQNHFYHSVKEITPRKNNFFGKIYLLLNSGDLDENNDVKHNIFRCFFQNFFIIYSAETRENTYTYHRTNVIRLVYTKSIL